MTESPVDLNAPEILAYVIVRTGNDGPRSRSIRAAHSNDITHAEAASLLHHIADIWNPEEPETATPEPTYDEEARQ